LEYIRGIELFDAIRDPSLDLLGTEEAKFYTSQLLLSIEYFHSSGIIYRDLKPENVMVDADGYLKIVETAKFLID